MFYLINDAVMQAGAFFIAGAAIYQHGARTVEEWASLRGSPWLTGALIILAMSMIGIPPTGGFFGKWRIMLGALEAGNYLAVGAVVVATLLTMAYFQRLFVSIFRVRQTPSSAIHVETPFSLRVSLGATSAAIIVLGLCSDPIIKFFRDTVASVGL
jgi:multicomponent Na+:H+ antiporter subunit D